MGSYLIRYLLRRGYTRIRAIKRPTSKFDLLAGLENRIEWVDSDLLDTIGLEDAMEGVEQVYHCAAMVSFNPAERDQMLRTNRDGTANIVNAALYAGVKKLVHVSSIAAIGRDKKSPWVDEDTKWVTSPDNSKYGISKFQAEQEVWRGQAEGLNVAVVNPSVILGAGCWDMGTAQFFKLGWREFPFYPVGASGFVDVRDVARFLILLMESDILGERFVLNGENRSYQSLQEMIAAALDRKGPRYVLSPAIARWAARLEWLRKKFTGKPPLITRENAIMTSLTYHYKNDKSIRTFDFDYIPIEQTVRETARLFKAALAEDLSPRVLPLKQIEELETE